MTPILLNSCARAATTAEARFRIDAPIRPSRGVRVFALDRPAGAVVRRVARRRWAAARFFAATGPVFAATGPGMLARIGEPGPPVPLAPQLPGIDVAVLVATTGAGAEAAARIGSACRAKAIMTAGLVLDGGGSASREAVSALRPYARVLLVTSDEEDVVEVLTALRA